MLGFDTMGRMALGQLEDHSRQLQIAPGAFVLSGGNVSSARLHADLGTFAISGQAAAFKATRRIAPAAGAFTLGGQTVGLHSERRLTANLGGFSFTGLDADLSRLRPFLPDPGVFTLTGVAVGIRATRTLAMGAGAFTLTGKPVTLFHAFPFFPGAGSFTLSGNAVGLAATRRFSALTGAFALTGQAAAFMTTRGLTAHVGSFSLTGVSVNLRAARYLQASPFFTDSMAWFGFAPLGAVAMGQSATQSRVTFRLSGNPATLMQGKGLIGGAGAFVLNGLDTRGLRQRDIRATIKVSAPSFKASLQSRQPVHASGRPGNGFKARVINPAS